MLGWVMKRLHEPVYRARQAELVRRIAPHLQTGDRVLDVGCGFGALGKALMNSDDTPGDLVVEGLESVPRSGGLIDITAYDGESIPFDDDAYDVVILADVLHHEPEPDRLIAECKRAAKRLLIIKDHKLDGPLAQQRIALIDWAANAPYGVPCLFRYNTPAQWTETFERHALPVKEQKRAMRLYPFGYNLLFGRRLQFFAVLRSDGSA